MAGWAELQTTIWNVSLGASGFMGGGEWVKMPSPPASKASATFLEAYPNGLPVTQAAH